MKASKFICVLASCLLMTSMPSCSLGGDNTSETEYSRPVLFKGYANIPAEKYYIPLYASDDVTSGGLTPVYFNDELDILADRGDWYEAKCGEYTGYIRKDYVSKELNSEEQRPTLPETTTTVTTTETVATKAATTTAAETTTKKEDTTTAGGSDAAETTTEAPATTAAQTTQANLPASAYPDVNISLDFTENNSNKYDIILTMDGRFTHYVYELHRIFADGTDKVIAKGESGETQLKLATVDSLKETQTTDRLIITTYLNTVAGNKVTLDLEEPKA